MFIPGYHNSYPPIIDAYGNRRFWPDYRGAFVGTHPTPGLGAAPAYYRITDAQTHDLRVAMGVQDALATARDPAPWVRQIFTGPGAPLIGQVGADDASASPSNVPLIVGGVLAAGVILILIAAAR